MSSVVFTSYAQADRRDSYLGKFVNEFRKTLGGFQGITGEEEIEKLAFFDRDMPGGEDWSPTIIGEMNNARVLICLLSHTYLRRPWCGRELQVFLDRINTLNLPAGNSARFIFPIWWQKPTKPRPLPSRLARLNWRDPKYPRRYDEGGVWGLYRKEIRRDYRAMADRLAELVHETLEAAQQLPPGVPVADVEQIRNAFDEQQEFDVRLLALTTNGDAWQPGPNDMSVAKAAEEAARKLQIFIRPIEQAVGLAAGLQQAQADQQIILLTVDANLATSAALVELDALNLPNLAVLLVESATPSMGPDAWLSRIGLQQGALAKAKTVGFFRVAGPGALAAEMQLLLDDAGTRLSAAPQPAKAEDPGLANLVRINDGINLDAQPHLASPGTSPSR